MAEPEYGTTKVEEEEEKPPKGPSSGQITEAIRQGFAFALLEAKVPPAIRTFLLDKATKLDDKLQNLAGKAFPDITSAQQGAYYFMQTYVIPAAENLGYDTLLGPKPDLWATMTKMVSDPELWYDRLEMVLYQTKLEQATQAKAIDPNIDPFAEPEPPARIAARAAKAVRATIPEAWQVAPPPGLKAPVLPPDIQEEQRLMEPYSYPPRGGLMPPGYVAPGGPLSVGEQIAESRVQKENYALAMKNAGYVPSVVPGVGREYGGQYWVRPGERGSSEAEEFARQGRNATFRAAVPMIKAGQTAADERLAKRAQEERIAAQVAPYTGTVPESYTARQAFEVGRGNLGALEALASGGRTAYESAKLGTNIEQKFGQARLRSEFPTPSAGSETRGWQARANEERAAIAQPWVTRRRAEPLAAQLPKEWEEYAAPRTYGWEKGGDPEFLNLPFGDFLKKRLAAKTAPALRGRSIFRFGRS